MRHTKAEFNRFRAEFKNAVKALEEEFDVKIDMGNIRYDKGVEFRTTLKVVNNSSLEVDGKIVDVKVKEYQDIAVKRWGFKSEWLGEHFKLNGKTYKLVGWNDRSNKYKVLAQDIEGKTVKVTPLTVKDWFDNNL